MAPTAAAACIAVLLLLDGCATSPPASPQATYAEAKSRYTVALERDIRASGFPFARLVPIPAAIEPYKPGAAFKQGSARPVSHACIVSAGHMPEAKKSAELWVSGPQPQFALEGELPDLVKAVAQETAAVARAATLKQAAMVSLADTIQVSLKRSDLVAALRNEPCLDALVANDVLIVQGILYGADAVANARYLDVGARQATVRNGRYRVMYDAAGNFYLQETKVRPKYWIMSGWRVEVKVVQAPATAEQRRQVLNAVADSSEGELAVHEHTPSDQEVRVFLETLRAASERRLR